MIKNIPNKYVLLLEVWDYAFDFINFLFFIISFHEGITFWGLNILLSLDVSLGKVMHPCLDRFLAFS